MTDEQKSALAWLDHMAARTSPGHGAEKAACTLKAMLAEPRMPANAGDSSMSIELDAALHWLKAMDNKAMGAEVQGHARTLLDAFALPRDEPSDEHSAARQCWERINEAIVQGPLPGNGVDRTAQRNGMVLAGNLIFDLAFPSHQSAPPPTTQTVWRVRWETETSAGVSDDLPTADDAFRMAREYQARNPACAVWITPYPVEA